MKTVIIVLLVELALYGIYSAYVWLKNNFRI